MSLSYFHTFTLANFDQFWIASPLYCQRLLQTPLDATSNNFRLPLFNYLLRCHRLICFSFFIPFFFCRSLHVLMHEKYYHVLTLVFRINMHTYTLIYVEENSNQNGLICHYITVSKSTYKIINFPINTFTTSHLLCRIDYVLKMASGETIR